MADTQPLTPTDAELTAIYKTANGEDTGKAQPLTTQRIFRAMRAAIAKCGKQPDVHRAPAVAFDDPRVQAVYEILCDDTDWPPKETPQQHWEGWIARRIVERLFQEPEEGANAHDMRYAHGGVAERCEEVKRAMNVVVELERRGMLEAQPVVREPLTDEQIRAMCKQSWVFDTAKQWVRITERAHGITGAKT